MITAWTILPIWGCWSCTNVSWLRDLVFNVWKIDDACRQNWNIFSLQYNWWIYIHHHNNPKLFLGIQVPYDAPQTFQQDFFQLDKLKIKLCKIPSYKVQSKIIQLIAFCIIRLHWLYILVIVEQYQTSSHQYKMYSIEFSIIPEIDRMLHLTFLF